MMVMREIVMETIRWLLLPIWVPAFLAAYAAAWIVVVCAPTAVWEWVGNYCLRFEI